MNTQTETASSTVTVCRLIIIALAYFITARMGLELAIIGSNITLIWLPTGIAVAALFRWGYRYGWAVWLGAFAVNLAIGSSIFIAFGISVGNTLAPVLAVALLRHWQFNYHISNWRDVPIFIAAGAFSMMVSATGVVGVLLMGGLLPLPAVNWAWLTWWLGDAVGVIVGGMALVTFDRDEFTRLLHGSQRKELLTALLIVAVVGFAWVTIPVYPLGHILLAPLIVLVLVWIALRLGAWAAAVAALTLSACAVFALATGQGPFVDQNLHLRIAELWAYMVTLSVVTMLVSAFSAERERIAQRLRDSEAFANSILNSLTWHIAVLDSDGVIISVNDTWRHFGVDNDLPETSVDMLGVNYLTVCEKALNQLHGDEVRAALDGIRSVLAGTRDSFDLEYPCDSPTEQRWFRMSVMPLIGTRHGVVISHENISKRKQAEILLRIAATVFESHNGMFITDANEVILNVNQAFTLITGYSSAEVIGQTPRLWTSGRQDKALYSALWQSLLNTGSWQGELWNRRKNGDIYPEWLTITAVKNETDEVTHYVATFIDITERKVTEETIHQLSFYDSLTQLPNRRLLDKRLEHAIKVNYRTGRQIAVLMLGLDKFKAVNDNFGHSVGDELLQQVAERINVHLREIDTSARLGGDEFVILMEDIDQYEAVARIADAIIHDLTLPFSVCQHHNVTIGASIGIAIYPEHGNSVETLMDNAATALYQAKDSGRGCFAYFSEELTQKARERLALENRLRRALAQQELQVYFQPQIDIVSNCIVGAEALVRWYDPIHGCVMPSDFIALAEETGLIIPLGEFVLRETCRLGQQWLSKGLPAIRLAVNVSPYQFSYCDINALVTQVLRETGFPIQYLELEITESGLMNNQQQAMTILNNLHELGVHLAIDDFGTGYSSLSYLKFFPLDILKIDKSFIDDIPFSQSDMAIAATIIAMAHHLGFKVLAEGVENPEQLAFLHEHGCDMYQGYLYSKAVSAEEFAKLLLNW
jgi:diguanylate cyclase (GGDEF)-like protein/PAS domain S-box-containing protein